MNAEVYLTGSGYHEPLGLGTIDFQPNIPTQALGRLIDICILTARGNNNELADMFSYEVEWSKTCQKDKRLMIRYSITITALDVNKVLGRVMLNTAFWDRFDLLNDICSGNVQAISKIRIEIAFTGNSEYANENPIPGTDFVIHPHQKCADEYVRVCHIQYSQPKPFTISRRAPR